MGKIALLAIIAVLVIDVAVSSGENKRENRTFMHEFALYVKDRIDHEAEIRQSLRRFLESKKSVLKDGGFGKHPEILPEMFTIAGVERLNCISGRYYDTLLAGLNNEERHAFYDVSDRMSWWVLQLGVEEAVMGDVYKPDPPLSFRRKTDIPEFIVEDLKRDIWPYLQERPGGGGLVFSNMTCN